MTPGAVHRPSTLQQEWLYSRYGACVGITAGRTKQPTVIDRSHCRDQRPGVKTFQTREAGFFQLKTD